MADCQHGLVQSLAKGDYLLIVDHFSDFWEIELLPDLSAETVINHCKAQFAQHGQPDRVITDNDPQFGALLPAGNWSI